MTTSGKLAVVAVGGNSLILDKKHQTVADQYDAACKTMEHVADMIQEGYNVVLTHGNGPQVGFILLRSEIASSKIHPVPLDSCGADTQGAIGYNFQMALGNEFKKRGIKKPVVTVVTQVLVDKDDPSFKKPTKPIGQFYTEAEAKEKIANDHWDMVEDAGRGWRRVVASPLPIDIIEKESISELVSNGHVVICAGGGGIPVIRKENGQLEGIAAVIDKDYASAKVAELVNADYLVILTAVDNVYIDFKKPTEKKLERVSVSEMKEYMKGDYFAKGSMYPKVNACVMFLTQKPGKTAIISSLTAAKEAFLEKAGTIIK